MSRVNKNTGHFFILLLRVISLIKIFEMRKTLIISTLFIAILSSCQFINDQVKKTKEKEIESAKDSITVRKYYYEKTKTLEKEITVKNNKKNGPAKEYYPSGELRQLVYYENSIRKGETTWYYKNGQPYRVTPYENGKINGTRKMYYENGKLQAEIPYKDGELQVGTIEYDKKGNIINNSPKFVFKVTDLRKTSNKVFVQVSLSNKYSKTEFFQETVSTQGKLVKVPMQTNVGVGKMSFNVQKGYLVNEVVKIYAQFKTSLRNPVLIQEDYNLFLDN
jgi:hypothetical protein